MHEPLTPARCSVPTRTNESSSPWSVYPYFLGNTPKPPTCCEFATNPLLLERGRLRANLRAAICFPGEVVEHFAIIAAFFMQGIMASHTRSALLRESREPGRDDSGPRVRGSAVSRCRTSSTRAWSATWARTAVRRRRECIPRGRR